MSCMRSSVKGVRCTVLVDRCVCAGVTVAWMCGGAMDETRR